MTTPTGTPQLCVLSSLSYIFYTNDCVTNYKNRYFLKFADDKVIVSLIENNEVCHDGPVVEDFMKWCDDACLQLNASKTKEMSIDFRALIHSSQATLIRRQKVDCVKSNIYFRTIIDNSLS